MKDGIRNLRSVNLALALILAIAAGAYVARPSLTNAEERKPADPLTVNASLAPLMAAMQTSSDYSCMPTCPENDGRMLIIAGDKLSTFVGAPITFQLLSRANSSTIEIGIFDPDSGGIWDSGVLKLKYELLVDPDGDGNGTVIRTWFSDDLTAYDNMWFTEAVPNDPSAQVGAFYSYLFRVSPAEPPGQKVRNAFKVRTDGRIGSLAAEPVMISLQAPTDNSLDILYPRPKINGQHDYRGSTYNGVWTFNLVVPDGATEIEIWDGDFDIGGYTYGYDPVTNSRIMPIEPYPGNQDTDDPGTPSMFTCEVSPGVFVDRPTPCFVTDSDSMAEKAAGIGVPADDNHQLTSRRTLLSTDINVPDDEKYLYGEPGLIYKLISPSNQVFVNSNPSGTGEWERFLITSGSDPDADYQNVGPLEPGIWQLVIEGLDASNLVALRLSNQVLAGTIQIGDSVWNDLNGDGIQDDGEPGIPNVIVELLDSNGTLLTTTTTNSSGLYYFSVESGTYTTRVADSNFDLGGVLNGFSPTVEYDDIIGGDNQRTQVVNSDLFTFDYGYSTAGGAGTGAIGDLVWLDADGDGTFDDGEVGIGNVTVILTLPDGSQEFMETNPDGTYQFTNLQPGVYSVSIDPSTLPAGVIKTTGPNPGANNNSQEIPYIIDLADGEDNPTADFGYHAPAPPTGRIGNYLWIDGNLNGLQDPEETPLPDITVRLKKPDGSIVQTTTNSAGQYLFTGLSAGEYEVSVDEETLPDDLAPTLVQVGNDPTIDSNFEPATVTLASNSDEDLTIDFGYVFRKDFCPPSGGSTTPGSGGTIVWAVDKYGNVFVRFLQSRTINDNAYGSNATTVGWNNHKFDHLYNSDNATFEFRNKSGQVVLKFAMDYLSKVGVKPGIPSGYASLGPNGGDGEGIIGNKSYVVYYNTSLAKNLNDLGFCNNGNCNFAGTNLLSTSPATNSNYEVVNEAFEPWEFTNYYEMKISKSAFGSSGFGSVKVVEIHNSPSKTGNESQVPKDCPTPGTEVCKLKVKYTKLSGKQLQVTLKNEGSSDAIINELLLNWPSSNGKLLKVKLDSNTIYSSSAVSSPATLNSSKLTSDQSKRKVPKGSTRVLIFEFEKYIDCNESKYSGTIKFGSTCVLKFGSSSTQTQFVCTAPVDALTMAWDGNYSEVYVTAWKGEIGKSTRLKDKVKVSKGKTITVSGYAGASGHVYWEIYKKRSSGSYEKIGTSKFYLSCADTDMNGPEDCGKRQGNGKGNYSGYLNDWIFRGMVDSNQTLSCPMP